MSTDAAFGIGLFPWADCRVAAIRHIEWLWESSYNAAGIRMIGGVGRVLSALLVPQGLMLEGVAKWLRLCRMAEEAPMVRPIGCG